jgi:hypothetical protein
MAGLPEDQFYNRYTNEGEMHHYIKYYVLGIIAPKALVAISNVKTRINHFAQLHMLRCKDIECQYCRVEKSKLSKWVYTPGKFP